MFHKGVLLATTAICVICSPAGAQTPATTAVDSQPGLEEIVVTAQRRTESLQDVPIAVTVVTSDALGEAGVRDVTDLKAVVPSLNLINSTGYVSSSLRGVGSNAVGAGIENPVALYVDGVYIGAPAASFLSLSDVSQVEVLKGPQGTLFGRNATGGLIQITTRKPTQQPKADVNLSYGNYQRVDAKAYVSGGLADSLSAGLAVQYSHQGEGDGRNLTTGKDAYQILHDFSGRAKLVFEPAEGTEFTLSGDHVDQKNTNSAIITVPGTVNAFAPAEGPQPDRGYDTATDVLPTLRFKGSGASLRWDEQIGPVALMSITAYRESRVRQAYDYDALSQDLERFTLDQRDEQFSQELQLTSQAEGKLIWVLGGYYYDASSEYDPFILTANVLGARLTSNSKQKVRSIAGYGQFTYEIFDRTRLTLGGRYTSEKRTREPSTVDIFVIPLGFSLPTLNIPSDDTTFNKFTFRVSLDHRLSDGVLAYASFNRGFKSGGYNLGVPGSAPFRPEILDAYELGLKTDLLDRRLRLNVAGFYYDYTDLQVQQQNAGSIQIVNGARARIYGVDADIQAVISRSFRLSGGVSVNHAKFRSFPGCQISTPAAGVPVTVGSCAGNRIPLAAKVQATANADYRIDLGEDSLNLNVSVSYNSGFPFEADNVLKQKEYVLLGASIKWTSADEHISASLFGRNLTNKRLFNYATTLPEGIHVGYYQAPRTYGVSVGFKY